MERRLLKSIIVSFAFVFAALPAFSLHKCAGGFVKYYTGNLSAGSGPAALDAADQKCISLWPNLSMYSTAGCYKMVYPTQTPGVYVYECWKCGDFQGPWLNPSPWGPVEVAVLGAFNVRPGTVIGVGRGELTTEAGEVQYVYHVDILQSDEVVSVTVDAMTGEVIAPEPSGVIDTPDDPTDP